MILFKPEMAEAILAGRKTVTRRRWKTCRVKVGNVYQARTRLFGKPFARLRILACDWEQYVGAAAPEPPAALSFGPAGMHGAIEAVTGALGPLIAALDEDGQREGFEDWVGFARVFRAMHGDAALRDPCWRIEFEVVT